MTHTMKDIKEKVHADSYSSKAGVFTLRWGFFYTHGKVVENKIEDVKSAFPEAVIVDYGTEHKDFRGGASVAQSSHWWVKFTFDQRYAPGKWYLDQPIHWPVEHPTDAQVEEELNADEE